MMRRILLSLFALSLAGSAVAQAQGSVPGNGPPPSANHSAVEASKCEWALCRPDSNPVASRDHRDKTKQRADSITLRSASVADPTRSQRFAIDCEERCMRCTLPRSSIPARALSSRITRFG